MCASDECAVLLGLYNLNGKILLLGLCLVLFSSISFASQEWTCDIKIPSTIEGCNKLACSVPTYEKTLKDVVLYKEMNLKSPVVQTLKRCSGIKSIKAFTVFTKYGKAKVNTPLSKDYLPKLAERFLKKGDILPVVFNLGEGMHQVCIGKDLIDPLLNYDDETKIDGKIVVRAERMIDVLEEPISETWYEIQSVDGVRGFAAPSKEIFFMTYGGYNPEVLCEKPNLKE